LILLMMALLLGCFNINRSKALLITYQFQPVLNHTVGALSPLPKRGRGLGEGNKNKVLYSLFF